MCLGNYVARSFCVGDCPSGTPIGRQESHALFGLSQSNALLRVAVGESFQAGMIVDLRIWD